MILIKLICFTSCLYMAWGSESSEEVEALLADPEGAHLMRYAVKLSYDENKLDLISGLVSRLQEDTGNVTLVGSQNIYGPDGKVVEVRTIELHIPQISKNNPVGSAADDEEDDDIDTSLGELKKMFDLISKLGFSMEVAAAEFNKTGGEVTAAYIDENIIFGYMDGFNFANKTIEVNSSEIVNKHIKELQAKYEKVAVLKFNATGEFLSEESNIVPEYIVSITEEDGDAGQGLLDAVQAGLAKIFLKYHNDRDKVPSKLSEYLNLEYPQYDHNVFLDEPEAWYVNKDYKINLAYELTNWDDSDDNINYSVFVLKKKDDHSVSK